MTEETTRARAAGWPRWSKGLALAIAWVGLWGLGHLGEFATHASLWYPPAALTFASLAVLGPRVIPYLARPWAASKRPRCDCSASSTS